MQRAGRPRPAREPAAGRHQPGRAGRGRHRPGPRAARRRGGRQPRADGRAGQDARGGGPDREQGGPARAHAAGHPPHRPERPRRAVQQARPRQGRPARDASAPASATSATTRPSPTSSATRSTSTSSARSATPSSARAAAPRCGSPPTTSRSSAPSTWCGRRTVLMLDLSLSMPMRDNFLPAKKVAMALHSLISIAVPARLPRHRRLQRGRPASSRPSSCPRCRWDFVYGTNMQHGFQIARRLLARQSGTKQIIMITDGEPTAHITPTGDVFFNYPPVRETVDATLREVARCTRDGIRINTFMLDPTPHLQRLHREAHRAEPGPGVLHHPRDPGRLRAGRLHRAAAPDAPRPPRQLIGA